MTHFLVLLLALLIGVVAGLRAFSAPAAIAWAAALQWINLDGTWASWMGNWFVVILLTVLAVVELVTDQLPKTPSRKTPVQFGARLVTGGLAGAALGTAWGYIRRSGRRNGGCGDRHPRRLRTAAQAV